jgi:hypothetical protein
MITTVLYLALGYAIAGVLGVWGTGWIEGDR